MCRGLELAGRDVSSEGILDPREAEGCRAEEQDSAAALDLL